MTDPIERIRRLPIWPGPVEPRPLSGGLSNHSFTVLVGGRGYVVRIGDDLPHHHVFRASELMASRAAHRVGLSPAVVHAEAGLMVLERIEGRTLEAKDVKAGLPRIAALVRRYHVEMPREVSGPASLFWPFHVIRDYARRLRAARSGWEEQLERLLAVSDELESAQQPLPLVFGHNDLLPANLIDDGSRLWLIDHEYAAFSTPMFDLAGIASNAGLTSIEDLALLGAYFGRTPDAALVRGHAAMKCVSLLREAMWGMVGELHPGAPGVDYGAYARDNLARFEAALADLRAGDG
jgi:thiamine kinase-like enzyme